MSSFEGNMIPMHGQGSRHKKNRINSHSVNRRIPPAKTRKHRNKFDSDVCDSTMTFHECELAILRNAIDKSENIKGKALANSEEIKKIITILEDFIIEKKVLIYGGTAVNNILPKFAQFYDRSVEIPDYDFYSPDALGHAKELADIYYQAGYFEVEAKAGIHMGTFKVFVNFIPIADITQMHEQLYKQLMKDAVIMAKIHYTPPNYLRMSMYLELSRPSGDLSRWEKVLKRLSLLNKHYPFKVDHECDKIDFHTSIIPESSKNDELYEETRNCFIDQGVVFFGGYATSLYSKYMPEERRLQVKKYPDYDVLAEDPQNCATVLKEHLQRCKFKRIQLIEHQEMGEIIPFHIEVRVDGKAIAFIYQPIACHSYNTIFIKENEVNVATIDTILTFYLSFWYADMDYYDKDRLLCMAKYLFEVEQQNRLSQHGLLRRFSINCYGKQLTLSELRSEKALKYKELMDRRDSKEYDMWFLKYAPGTNTKGNGKRLKKSAVTPQKEIVKMKMKKKEDRLFSERFIGTPRQSKKKRRTSSSSSSLLNFITKKNKNSQSEFLF